MIPDVDPFTGDIISYSRYVIYDLASESYLGRNMGEDVHQWAWNDWTGDVMAFEDTDLAPMYSDQYDTRAVSVRRFTELLPIGVSVGRFIECNAGFNQIIVVPLHEDGGEWILDYCNAFELKDYQ